MIGLIKLMKSCVKDDLMQLGFCEHQARRIIQLAKEKLVILGHEFYVGSKIGRVPA